MSGPRRHLTRWLAIGIGLLALAIVGGPFVYIHLMQRNNGSLEFLLDFAHA